MSLRKYFKLCSSLPTPEQTGIGEQATTDANNAVSQVIANTDPSKGQRKHRTMFSGEDRAAIGRYVADNSNISAIKKVIDKCNFLNPLKVQCAFFKKKYTWIL
jgi:hypothetical protein